LRFGCPNCHAARGFLPAASWSGRAPLEQEGRTDTAGQRLKLTGSPSPYPPVLETHPEGGKRRGLAKQRPPHAARRRGSRSFQRLDAAGGPPLDVGLNRIKIGTKNVA
jgi:hypothetical protein